MFPLFIGLSSEIISPETQTISFTVNANDEDLDPLTYEAQGLPFGASFDAIATRKFSWTPSLLQAGEYEVRFVVRDNNGGLDDEVVNITVTNLNRPPQITAYQPIQGSLVGHKSVGETFNFSINVNDQDIDEPTDYDDAAWAIAKNGSLSIVPDGGGALDCTIFIDCVLTAV